MFEIIIYIITFLITITIVGGASSAGFLNSGLTRAFGGIGTQWVSLNFLHQYTNFETFIRGCYAGQVGIIGYVYLLSLGALIAVWFNNLYEYRQAIM